TILSIERSGFRVIPKSIALLRKVRSIPLNSGKGCRSMRSCYIQAMPKRIVILGAGFGGIEAAVESARQWRGQKDVHVVLVSEHNYFMFTPLLPQIASSYINPRHIVQPIRDLRGRQNFDFVRDSVQGIDLNVRQVHLASGPMAYDYLIVALGSRTDY